ncbi:MAG: hypothetical protein HUJ73_02180 [Eubacterium sp.]|nr:hypothetical protein [Eubacterium sp.]
MASVFERMISDFSRQETAKQLADCMSVRPDKIDRIPLRYRLIARGFVRGSSLEELNQSLADTGCEQLYARNRIEAGILYAFRNRLSYGEWKVLEKECEEISAGWTEGDDTFGEGNITFGKLKAYVENNSAQEGEDLQTLQKTRAMQQQIVSMQGGSGEFRQFLMINREAFSQVREKTRYYFCKFLCYYIERKILQYFEARRKGTGVEEALAELSVLKSAAKLRKKMGSEEEIRQMFHDSAISCGNLYDAFNYFFFDYVSSDWMEVLLDYYGGDITDLPPQQKKELARALRSYNGKWKDLGDEEVLRLKWQEMEENEALLDRIYAADSDGKGYQKNRSGEKSVRNYIKGTLDIDRTTLICYLLFFGSEYAGEKERPLTKERIEEILTECGFAGLQKQDAFDQFVVRYLQEKDPVSYLMEEVTKYALEEKNFFLYHMYRESVSNDAEIRKVMGLGK